MGKDYPASIRACGFFHQKLFPALDICCLLSSLTHLLSKPQMHHDIFLQAPLSFPGSPGFLYSAPATLHPFHCLDWTIPGPAISQDGLLCMSGVQHYIQNWGESESGFLVTVLDKSGHLPGIRLRLVSRVKGHRSGTLPQTTAPGSWAKCLSSHHHCPVWRQQSNCDPRA